MIKTLKIGQKSLRFSGGQILGFFTKNTEKRGFFSEKYRIYAIFMCFLEQLIFFTKMTKIGFFAVFFETAPKIP